MPTSTVKRIVCLANSRKLSGRCIAGKELLEGGRPGGWVRPVSAREKEEVSEYERQYQDGSDPRVLDVIDVPLSNALPKDYQLENWLLDPNNYWKRVQRVASHELTRFTDPVARLWIVGDSTRNGLNDQVPVATAIALRHSLLLVRVSDLTLSVFSPREAFGDTRRRVQGRFSTGGTNYWLWVTDPEYERKYF